MQCCPRRWYSWDNIAQVKSLCSAGFGALDNITHKQTLFNVFLIILGQHCTGQKPCNVVQRHHATMHRKNLVPCCLNTLGSWGNISEVKSLCNVAWEATALHKKKPLLNVVLILLGQHCTGNTLCNIVPEALDNTKEKIQTIVPEQHLVLLVFYPGTTNGMLSNYAQLNWGSVNLFDMVWPTDPGS